MPLQPMPRTYSAPADIWKRIRAASIRLYVPILELTPALFSPLPQQSVKALDICTGLKTYTGRRALCGADVSTTNGETRRQGAWRLVCSDRYDDQLREAMMEEEPPEGISIYIRVACGASVIGLDALRRSPDLAEISREAPTQVELDDMGQMKSLFPLEEMVLHAELPILFQDAPNAADLEQQTLSSSFWSRMRWLKESVDVAYNLRYDEDPPAKHPPVAHQQPPTASTSAADAAAGTSEAAVLGEMRLNGEEQQLALPDDTDNDDSDDSDSNRRPSAAAAALNSMVDAACEAFENKGMYD
ncbi:unnamed protein product [Vitrella brassicaformis CCMP3155]|uniref:Uncharacterized protein n=1 Tax=Vitrella brassicaformis (strain CCMP3155) TaxID=1169540 RepID=A0A0G4FY72_VITBC|nr:unnamed protein product [Vitrella brassicaformis CCMP3155]|eukprot:CEM20111.1 unnamed protein product [Vitrella brassicaformis CCMP3155]